MRSIAGFNGSSINGSFAAGESISAAALNKLATGIDITRSMPSNDILYQANTNGTAYTLPQQVYYGTSDGLPCAGQIYNLRYDVDEDEYYINITPFHVNGLIVTDYDDNLLTDEPPPNIQVFTTGISTDSENPSVNYIYVVCEASDATAEATYPVDDPPPYIVVETSQKSDTNDVAYFLIGIVTGWTDAETDVDTLTIQNFKGCGSLMTARLMCGSGSATYFWSAV